MPKEEEEKSFLLALVNAHDGAQRVGLRSLFMKRYRGWLPDEDNNIDQPEFQRFLKTPRLWLCKTSYKEQTTSELALNILILRDRLRFIWTHSHEEEFAREALYELRMTFQYHWSSGKEWRHRLISALCFLEANLSRLLICPTDNCDGQNRYFFREWNNQKYCCEECSRRGHELKAEQRRNDAPPKQFEKSAETRRKMAMSAEARWRRTRGAAQTSRRPNSPG